MDTILELKKLPHKAGVNSGDWDRVHKNLVVLADYVLAHCHTHNLPLVITSIIRPRIPGASKTDIHSKGRAFDISVRGWSEHDIKFLVDAVNEKFTIGAISLSDGREREALYEPTVTDASGNVTKTEHLHFQVRP